jgi:DNA-binding MarR family transcriptional regulator
LSTGESKKDQAENPGLKASLAYGDFKAEFSGSPEDVIRSIDEFILKQIPAFSLAKKLLLNYSFSELVEGFKDFVRLTPEGPRIINHENLSDKELVALQLVAHRISSDAENGLGPSVSLSSLLESTGLNPKSLSSRLSELSKTGLVVRESTEEGNRFRITTQGITWLKQSLAKRAD